MSVVMETSGVHKGWRHQASEKSEEQPIVAAFSGPPTIVEPGVLLQLFAVSISLQISKWIGQHVGKTELKVIGDTVKALSGKKVRGNWQVQLVQMLIAKTAVTALLNY